MYNRSRNVIANFSVPKHSRQREEAGRMKKLALFASVLLIYASPLVAQVPRVIMAEDATSVE